MRDRIRQAGGLTERERARQDAAVQPLRRSRRAWGLAALDLALVCAALASQATGAVDLPLSLDESYPVAVFGLALPALGAAVLSRDAGRSMGRLLLTAGTGSAVALAAFAYAQYGLVQHPGALPGALLVAWVSSWVWVTGVPLLLLYGLLLFPDAQLPGPRWRAVPWLAATALSLLVLSNALRPGDLVNHPVRRNPLAGPGAVGAYEAAGAVGFLLFMACLGAGVVALAVRWRRAPVQDRAAIGWLLVAAVPLTLVAAAPEHGGAAVAAELVAMLAVPFLPFALAVGVFRHRLYGSAPVVRRSLVWWSVTTMLLAVYAATAALVDAALRGRSGAPVALAATGAVAVLSAPLRDRAQRAADRLLFGERGDPDAALARLGRRVGDAPGADQLLDLVARTVAEALRAPYVAVTLSGDPAVAPSAAFGRDCEHVHEVVLVLHGETVGVLQVGLRPGEHHYGPRDVRLLADLAPQVAAAAHAVLLRRALESSRERLARALEEERRRVRRDLHDGLGPALTGVAFTAAAAHNSLDDHPDRTRALLEQLSADARACVDEVRRISHDLRPPALDELGLPAALDAYATRLASDGGPTLLVSSDPLPPLPAAVEVAAYRIGVEAMTNAVRHSRARCCRLHLELAPGSGSQTLLVTVDDDGAGIPAQRRAGVGLSAMSERAAHLGGTCTARPRVGGGTRVRAELPLASP